MPMTLSIENAPDDVVRNLRLRAQRHHRSLQSEALAIIAEAVRSERGMGPTALLAEVRRLGLSTTADAAAIIRADRNRGQGRRRVGAGGRSLCGAGS